MRRVIFSMSLFALLCFAAIGSVAASGPIDFESGYTTGNINGQNSWSKTGAYDVAVANVADFANASGFGFGTKALRISNAVTSGSFGDQTFAPLLAQPSSESSNSHFEATFALGSVLSTPQANLSVSVSPDNGQGARMSYLRFVDDGDSGVNGGIHVFFDDVTDAGPVGTVAEFNENDIATLSRGAAHTVRFSIYFVPGPGNDLVRIYLDGVLKTTGTTWEDYYRYDPEQSGSGNVVSPVATVLFRTGGTAVPANLNNGYLIDNFSYSTASVPSCTTTCYVDSVSGNDAFGGTSPSDAKKHIQTAIDTVSSNGTVRVLPGHYQEAAQNVTPTTIAATYNFGLFFPSAKPGITVMGVDGGDNPITDATATQADVTTVGDANFGPDGVFVEAANTTIQGLTINGNLDPASMAESDNKTIEVVADNFTLKNSKTNVPD